MWVLGLPPLHHRSPAAQPLPPIVSHTPHAAALPTVMTRVRKPLSADQRAAKNERAKERWAEKKAAGEVGALRLRLVLRAGAARTSGGTAAVRQPAGQRCRGLRDGRALTACSVVSHTPQTATAAPSYGGPARRQRQVHAGALPREKGGRRGGCSALPACSLLRAAERLLLLCNTPVCIISDDALLLWMQRQLAPPCHALTACSAVSSPRPQDPNKRRKERNAAIKAEVGGGAALVQHDGRLVTLGPACGCVEC